MAGRSQAGGAAPTGSVVRRDERPARPRGRTARRRCPNGPGGACRRAGAASAGFAGAARADGERARLRMEHWGSGGSLPCGPVRARHGSHRHRRLPGRQRSAGRRRPVRREPVRRKPGGRQPAGCFARQEAKSRPAQAARQFDGPPGGRCRRCRARRESGRWRSGRAGTGRWRHGRPRPDRWRPYWFRGHRCRICRPGLARRRRQPASVPAGPEASHGTQPARRRPAPAGSLPPGGQTPDGSRSGRCRCLGHRHDWCQAIR
jgi:hypothetical protein